MEIVQILIGSMFSLIAMASVLYLAFRAHTIAGDLAEIKDLLKEARRLPVPTPAVAEIASLERVIGVDTLGHAPGEWPSVMDPNYNTEDTSRPSGLQR
ncbi:hypothetical protein F183_A44520 [Bryobacterales bacterium F-183]|nr:hypothetical protein F183_A44520 [Bryobacterales bacterium F-183]